MENTARIARSGPLTGLVLNVMRFSLHDGPGIRTTIFLKGCPLNCSWCHNPESQSSQPEVMYAKDRCIGCGDCVKACEQGALELRDNLPLRRIERCIQCGECAETCMTEARRFVGTWMTVDEVLSDIRRDIVFFDESGGGVTFSGGEPLMQPDFLQAALNACKTEGIHTTVDTSGYASPEVLARVSDKVDLFLFDLKMLDPVRHRKFTGVDNAPILKNLATLAKAKRRVVVRIPIVPSINDDGENIRQSMQLLARHGLKDVDLLSYHETGVDKCQRIGVEYGLQGVNPPSAERMQELSDQFSREGFTVRIGG